MLYIYSFKEECFIGRITDLGSLEYASLQYEFVTNDQFPKDSGYYTKNWDNEYYTRIKDFGEYALVDKHDRIVNVSDITQGYYEIDWDSIPIAEYRYNPLRNKRNRNGVTYRRKNVSSAGVRQELSRAECDTRTTGNDYRVVKHSRDIMDWDFYTRSHKGRTWKQKKIRYQWQKNVEHPTVSYRTGFKYPYNKFPYVLPEDIPLKGTRYMYIGESDESFVFGEYYEVIYVDQSYDMYSDRRYIWMADETYLRDYDSAQRVDVEDFHGMFID